MGDFNTLLNVEDRRGGSLVQETETRDFNEYLIDTATATLTSVGRDFTWSNGSVFSKIDWAIVNAEWMINLPPGADHYDFNKIVDVAWQEHTTADTILGRTWQKVQHVRRGFKQLDTGEYKKVGAKVKCLRELLTQIQAQMRDHNQYSVLAEHEREIRRQLEKWLNVEESIMSQKSRIQWLALGDSNTAFFHASLKCSYAQNSIHKLINGHGDLLYRPDDIKIENFHFYKDLQQLPAVNLAVMRKGSCLDRHQQLILVAPVTPEEVVFALKGIDDLKAPRCDGFNAFFTKGLGHG
ncbi:hypothetical protein KY284_033330 [Solanum tuberosum]|nr:hypothetical protein KY284_033330 [Solanum tuberosum]